MSLNVEAGFLAKLIYTGDKKTLADEKVKPQLLTGSYKNCYEFIIRHVRDYGSIPSVDAVRRYFPSLELPGPKKVKRENLAWWANELRRKHKHNRLADMSEKVIELLQSMDPDKALAIIQGTVKDIASVATRSRDLKLTEMAKVMKAEYKRIEKTGGMVGLATMFKSLDNLLGGLDGGQLISIIARPNTGKTWLLLIILFNIWKQGYTVALATREMSEKQMAARFMSLYTGLPHDRIRKGKLTPKERKKYFKALVEVSQRKNQFIIFYAEAGVTYLRAKIDEYKPDILGVDGMYLMDDDLGATDEWNKVTNITRSLKATAMVCNIPIIGTGQANRSTSKKTGPELDNISFSDSVGQDSDVVIGLNQTEEMRNDQELEARVMKSRDSARGRVMITWDFDNMNFAEIYADMEGSDGDDEERKPKKRKIGDAPEEKKRKKGGVGTPPPSVREKIRKAA